jgi:hypothetical protein
MRRETYAWWNTMIEVGSNFLVSIVERAVTPNPLVKASDGSGGIKEKDGAHKWNVAHAVHDNPLVFWGVFRYTPKMCFNDVIAIEKRHFAVWFYPYLDFVNVEDGVRIKEN